MANPTQPSFEEFEKNFQAGQTQLVWQWLPGDLETPVSAYLKLCGDAPYCFLLESVEGGATLGRYSIIGMQPDLLWSCDVKTMESKTQKAESKTWEIQQSPPLDSLREQIKLCKIDTLAPDLPPMAVSGLFGYMGYDMVRLSENIPDTNPDDLGISDSILMRPTILTIFDNVKNMICLVTPVYKHAQNSDSSAQESYDNAVQKITDSVLSLKAPLDHSLIGQESNLPDRAEATSNTTESEYHAMVNQAVEYIRAGEIFQVVPGQRFTCDFDLPPFELYRSIRRLNPSPFLFHVALNDFALVGASPEILVRVRDDTVTIRPIAGTRKRGKTAEEDKALAEDLLSDPKERAEHLMLLDLGRNDVGRVAEIGSINVTDEFIIEYYSHVMHIVSNVEGKLRADKDIIDALMAGFPAGTVSGAPKVRAMEIIDELEKSRRSYYGGCIGYLSGNGVLDTCIALRTALVKDGKMHIQAGGGVVADSLPDFERQESQNKAQAMLTAAQTAIQDSKIKSNY